MAVPGMPARSKAGSARVQAQPYDVIRFCEGWIERSVGLIRTAVMAALLRRRFLGNAAGATTLGALLACNGLLSPSSAITRERAIEIARQHISFEPTTTEVESD